MAREINLTTQKQEFFKECYIKENLTRINWCRHYGQNLPRLTNTKRKVSRQKAMEHFKLPEITETNIHGSMDKKKPEYNNSNETNQIPIDKEKMFGETSCFTDPLMRLASPQTQNLLYSGTSKEEQGRYRYMKIRNNLKPEDKYSYPIVSSWEYGWQIGNATISNDTPYRRCRIVRDTFFRKNEIPCELHPKDMALSKSNL